MTVSQYLNDKDQLESKHLDLVGFQIQNESIKLIIL